MAKEKKSGLNEWETLARSLQEIEEKKELEETKPAKGRGRSSKKAENEVKEASEMKKPVKRARNPKAETTPEEVVEQKDLDEVVEKKVTASKAKVKKENVAKPKKRVKKATSSKETVGKETAKKTVKASAPSLDLISQITKLAENKEQEQEENTDSFAVSKINLENDDFSLDDFFANSDEDGLEISWGRSPHTTTADTSDEEEVDLSYNKKESEAIAQDDVEEDLAEDDPAVDDFSESEDLLSDVPEIIEQVVVADADEVEVLISLTAVDPDDDLLSETTTVNSEHDVYEREVGSRRDGDSRRGRRNRGRRDRSDRSGEDRDAVAQNTEDRRNGSRNANGPKAEIKKATVSEVSDVEEQPVAEKADTPKEFSLNDFFSDGDEDILDIAWGKPSRFTASEKAGEQKKGKVEEIGFSPKKVSEIEPSGEKKEFSGNRRDRSRDDRRDRRNSRSDQSVRFNEGNNESRDCRANRRNDRNPEFRNGAEERLEDRRDVRHDESSPQGRENRSRDDRRREDRGRSAINEGISCRDRGTQNADGCTDSRENTFERRDSERPDNRRNAERRVKQDADDRQGRLQEDRPEKSMPSWEEAISLVVKNNMARHGNRHDNNKKRR